MSKITTERRGHLLLIGFNRAEKMNAFDVEMLHQLSAAFVELEEEPELRCGVLHAQGPHFTAGLDLADVGPALAEGRLDLRAFPLDPWGVHGRARTKPTVVAVQGRCLTLGIELCLAQDVCVADSTARFGQIEVKRGIFPFGGASFRLVQTAGWGNAMRWLLTGDEFDAAEAHRIGLIQEVTEPGQALERALALAESIASQAPLGVQAVIASARSYLAEEAAARELLPQIMKLMRTKDAREGMLSFMERREARFTGG